MLNYSLPSYNDEEVRVFHPLCKKILIEAIKLLQLQDILEVRHHERIKKLEADFVIVNKSSQKYVLIIEVKRTPAQVSSIKYRSQAQLYVQESLNNMQNPYYLLTNLEKSVLFRYDKNKPSVEQQILEPGIIHTGDFSKDLPLDFQKKGIAIFSKLIEAAYNGTGSYNEVNSTLLPILQDAQREDSIWHESVLLSSYDYIRGVLVSNNKANNWRAGHHYQSTPSKLSTTLNTVDFEQLASKPYPERVHESLWHPNFSESMYQYGKESGNGEELAELLHSMVIQGKEHEGLVPTDLELANLVTVLSKYVLGRDLLNEEVICDPAAGGGNLLTAALNNFYTVDLNQIWANDVEKKFMELLNIRLSLKNIFAISPDNAPKITNLCVTNLEKEMFTKVKMVLLNPPYVSGVKDTIRKQEIAKKISILTSQKSKTLNGQIGLEAPFLELITQYCQDETIIATILPKQYLTNRSDESQKFREFLISTFGLELIFTYSRKGIFEKVKKDTVVLIGKKGCSSNSIKHIHSNIQLANINPQSLLMKLHEIENIVTEPLEIKSGIVYQNIRMDSLEESIQSGWNHIYTSHSSFEKYMKKISSSLMRLKDSSYKLSRGRIGNLGASDLIFITENQKLWSSIEEIVPQDWLLPGIRTVDSLQTCYLSKETIKTRVLAPPEDAFTEGTSNYIILEDIINHYLEIQINLTNNKQVKKIKTKLELLNILKKEKKKITPSNTILVPRNIRRTGRCFLTRENCYVSTNLIEVSNIQSEIEAYALLSWITSLFGQAQLEYLSKDNEGARKTEINSLKELLIPAFIPLKEMDSVFKDLKDLQIDHVDKMWSELLEENEESLNILYGLMEEMIYLRLFN